MNGHSTQQHWLSRKSNSPIRTPAYSWSASSESQRTLPRLQEQTLANFLIQPSTIVKRIMDGITSQWRGRHVIALAIRTGETDWKRFLSEVGPARRFIACYDKISDGDKSKFVAFLSTDSPSVAEHVKNAVKVLDLDVTYVDDPIVITHQEHGSESTAGITKIYADFFLLQKVDTAILTHGSLFGSTAIRFRDPPFPDHRIHYVSDENCVPGEYPGCATPKFPVCSE